MSRPIDEVSLFNWLKENLDLTLDSCAKGDYYGTWDTITASVYLKNPHTKEWELIRQDSTDTESRSIGD
jgi:hypothetical protein